MDSSCLEYLIECAADGIGLYHISGESKGDDDQYGENSGQYFAEFSLKCSTNIVHGTACHLSVFGRLILLGKSCLRVDRGHAEECAHPHPEDGARTSADQSGCSSRQITGSDLCGDGCRHRLEGCHLSGFSTLFFFSSKRKIAEDLMPAFSELSYLNEFQANGVVDPGAAKYDDEHHIPQKVTRLTYKLC